MAAGDYQLIWVAQGTSGGGGGGGSGGPVNLSQLTQGGATTGQAIVWNGSAWTAGTIAGSGTGTLNALTGDVTTGTPDGSGNAAATVARVGSYLASDVVNAVASVATATAINQGGAIVKRDSSGNAAFGTVTAALSGNATTATTAANLSGTVTPSQITQGGATSGQALLWNGTAWAAGTVSAGGASGITQLNGDVTTPAASSGNTTATVASVGGSSASAINSAVTTVSNATNANTASTLVKRDASNNFSAGTITANLSGNATTATTAASATAYSGAVALSQLSQTSATSGQAIVWNGTAYAPATVGSLTALTGDVSASGAGSQAATVNSVGGSSASAVNTAVTTVAAATNAATANTLVKRDASNNFSAGTITASLTGNATNITGNLALGQLAQGGATSGQGLLWNGTAWAAGTISSGGGGITQLTGDVTTPASSSGSTVATVANVGGQTAAYIATGAQAANQAQVAASFGGYIVARNTSGAAYFCNATYALGGSSITAAGTSSGITYIADTGTNTVTLPANPSGVSYSFRFVGTGGTLTVAPPTTGTTPTFYYWGGSTIYSFNVVNQQTANYIEVFGIPGTSNYVLTNIQGNWQSAGSALGVYSALSYPSTSGYVLTANGNTGLASFQAAAGGSGSTNNTASTGVSRDSTTAARFAPPQVGVTGATTPITLSVNDSNAIYTYTGTTTDQVLNLPATASGTSQSYRFVYRGSGSNATTAPGRLYVYPPSSGLIYMNGTFSAGVAYIVTSCAGAYVELIGIAGTNNYYAIAMTGSGWYDGTTIVSAGQTSRQILKKNADYAMTGTEGDCIIQCTVATAGQTITLPGIIPVGTTYKFVREATSGNLSVAANGTTPVTFKYQNGATVNTSANYMQTANPYATMEMYRATTYMVVTAMTGSWTFN